MPDPGYKPPNKAQIDERKEQLKNQFPGGHSDFDYLLEKFATIELVTERLILQLISKGWIDEG